MSLPLTDEMQEKQQEALKAILPELAQHPTFSQIKEPRLRKIALMRYWLLDFALKLRKTNRKLTDRVVAKHFGVSCKSAQQVLDELCDMGYAMRTNRKGSKREYQLLPPNRQVARSENYVDGLIVQLVCGHVRGIPEGGKPDKQYRCLDCLEHVTKQIPQKEAYNAR